MIMKDAGTAKWMQVAMLYLLTSSVMATTCEWTSKVSRAWSVAGNWSNGVPTSADIALFTAKGTKVNPLLDAISVPVLGVEFTDNSAWTIDASASSATNIVVGASGIYGSTGTITFNAAVTNLSDNIWSNSAGTITFANTVDGIGKISKYGAGIVSFSKANTFSGGFDLYQGQVTIGNNAALGTGMITVYGGLLLNAGSNTKTLTNNLNVESNCVMGGTSASYSLVWAGTNTMGLAKPVIGKSSTATPIVFGGIVQGYGFVASNIAQTIAVTNIYNTFTGGVDVIAGTLAIGPSNCLGTGTVALYPNVVFGAYGSYAPVVTNVVELWGTNITMTASGQSQNYFGEIVLKAPSVIKAQSSRTATFNGSVDDLGLGYDLTNSGAGIVTLATNNTLLGRVVQTAGTLNMGNPSALGTNVFEIRGGTIGNTYGAPLTLTNDQLWAAAFTYSTAQTLNIHSNAVITLGTNITLTISSGSGYLIADGCITGSWGLTKASSGQLWLRGTNTFDGPIGISGGTIQYYNLNNIGSGTPSSLGSPTTEENGTIKCTGASTFRYLGDGNESTDRKLNVNSNITFTFKTDSTGGPVSWLGGCTTNFGSISIAGSNTTLNVLDFSGSHSIIKGLNDPSWWRLIGTNTDIRKVSHQGGRTQVDGYWSITNFSMNQSHWLMGTGIMPFCQVDLGINEQRIAPGSTNEIGFLTISNMVWYTDYNVQRSLVTKFDVGTNDTLVVLNLMTNRYPDPEVIPGIKFYFYELGTTNYFFQPGTYNLAKYGRYGDLNPALFTVATSVEGGLYRFSFTDITNGHLQVTMYTNRWDGGGSDNNWQTAQNWSSDVAPTEGDRLLFEGTNRIVNTNDFPVGTYFQRLSVSTSSNTWIMSGNSFGVGGMAKYDSIGTNILTMPVSLVCTGGTTVANFTVSGGALIFSNTISQTQADTVFFGDGLTFSLCVSNDVDIFRFGSYSAIELDHPYCCGTGVVQFGATEFLFNMTGSPLTYPMGMEWDGNMMFSGSDMIFQGPINNTPSCTLYVTNNVTFDGVMKTTAKRKITKQGPGTLTLNGENTFTNVFINAEGKTLVNGSLSFGTVTTNGYGATLGGTGIFYDGVVCTNGSILSPGTSIGTLTVSNLTLEAGVTNVFELGPVAASDKVVVSNDLVLGGTIQILPAAGFGSGTYTLFTYGGTITTNGVVTLDSSAMPAGGTYELIDNGAGKSIDLLATISGDYYPIVNQQKIQIINGGLLFSQ